MPVFSTKPRDAEAKQLIAEQRTLASIDAEIDAWHDAQPPMTPPPIVVEHPPEPGDSALLGGSMSIHAPWKRD